MGVAQLARSARIRVITTCESTPKAAAPRSAYFFFHHFYFAWPTEWHITLKLGNAHTAATLGGHFYIPHNRPVMSPRIRIVVMGGERLF